MIRQFVSDNGPLIVVGVFAAGALIIHIVTNKPRGWASRRKKWPRR